MDCFEVEGVYSIIPLNSYRSWMLKDQKITVGTVCFIRDIEDKKVLLLKRNNHPMKDLYTGIGGKTHFDEDIHLSCIREAKEETGLDIFEVELKAVIM